MEGNRGKTSFRQFQYCSFCHINHKKGKKHLYSTKHTTIIHNILDKTKKKITMATDTLSDPVIEKLGGAAMDEKFWCYYCVSDVPRHQKLDVCLLKFGSMLEHISSKEHKEKTADFFRVHRVDEAVRGRDEHCLTPGKLEAYKVLTVYAVRRFEERQSDENKVIAKKFREQEITRRNIVQSEDWKTVTQQLEFSDPSWRGSVSTFVPDRNISSSGVSTFLAHGEGVTFIGTQDYIEEEGNVHTGGLPPWLQAEEDHDPDRAIGPTLEDFKKHVASEQKKKLPACRVGAKLDRKQDNSDNWLPSFGQVWNSGRRLNSKKYFEKETKQMRSDLQPKANRSIQTSSGGTGEEISVIARLHTNLAVPYKSKRQRFNYTSDSSKNNGGDASQVGHDIHSTTNAWTYESRNNAGFESQNTIGHSNTFNSPSSSHGVSDNILTYPTQEHYRELSVHSRQNHQGYVQCPNGQDRNAEISSRDQPPENFNLSKTDHVCGHERHFAQPYTRKRRGNTGSEHLPSRTMSNRNESNSGVTSLALSSPAMLISTPVLDNKK